MKPKNFNYYKKRLEKIASQHIESTSLQRSASKILSFIINDMLDYAQLSAG